MFERLPELLLPLMSNPVPVSIFNIRLVLHQSNNPSFFTCCSTILVGNMLVRVCVPHPLHVRLPQTTHCEVLPVEGGR
jgi:hypothetical protein